MAINLMNETDDIKCDKCGHIVFKEEQFYFYTKNGSKIDKTWAYTKVSCAKCGEQKDFE